jgi:hypothetical protein
MPYPTIKDRPVSDFDMTYEWFDKDWVRLFDAQIEHVRADVERARSSDKLVVYLSCPISSRGGGHSGTNVDIALATQRRLLDCWGEEVWILNPANYQMESRAGTGLMNQHARRLNIDLEALLKDTGEPPRGGDYMRMWTKILVENGSIVGRRKVQEELKNSGQFFDAYYFLGPKDVHRFFVKGQESLTAGIESYFARRMESDPEFRVRYSSALTSPAPDWDAWEVQRQDFLRFYLFRASANYSLGCHDEWNIWLMLNSRRRERQKYGLSEQIAGYFEGRQLSPGAFESETSAGYAL